MELDQSQLSDEQIIGQVLAGRTELYEMLVRKYWRLAVATALGGSTTPPRPRISPRKVSFAPTAIWPACAIAGVSPAG